MVVFHVLKKVLIHKFAVNVGKTMKRLLTLGGMTYRHF